MKVPNSLTTTFGEPYKTVEEKRSYTQLAISVGRVEDAYYEDRLEFCIIQQSKLVDRVFERPSGFDISATVDEVKEK
jgi:hypothetical protein